MKYKRVLAGTLLLFTALVFILMWYRPQIINPETAEDEMFQNVSEKLSINPVVHENPEIQLVLNKARDIFNDPKIVDKSIYFDNAAYMQWQNKNGWYISDTKATSIAAYYTCENNAVSQLDSIIPQVYPKLEKIFSDRSFVKKSTDGQGSFDVAFEKGAIRCLINATQECFGFPGGYGETFGSPVRAVCSDTLSENEKIQVPILESLNLTKDPSNVINRFKYFDDYIFVGLSMDHLIARKQPNGSYIILYRGQDSVTCEEASKMGLPLDFQNYLNRDRMACEPLQAI